MDHDLSKDISSLTVKSPTLVDNDLSKATLAINPMNSYSLSSTSLSATTSPMTSLLSNVKPHVDSQKVNSNSMSVQYIVCHKCGKHRAVPA